MGNFYNRAFIKDDEVWVTIKDHRDIPFVGKGPINNPIRISKDNYKVLQSLGYQIVKLSNMDLIRKPLSRYYNLSQLVDNKIDEEVVHEMEDKVIQEEVKEEEPVVEEAVEEVVDDIKTPEVELELPIEVEEVIEVIEEPVEEVKEGEPVAEQQPKYDVDNMTKDQLKALLDMAEVPYKYKNTVDELRALVRSNIEIV